MSTVLDNWFGPQQAAPVVNITTLPKRVFGISVHFDRVVIERGRGANTLAFTGTQAQAVRDAINNRIYRPLAPGRSKNSAPIRYMGNV